ncbi:MAG: glycosyltransferase [Geobacter sp.]|nr:glycosyltransferase [Geobacter sp.]
MNVLFIEVASDGTVGGSHTCLYNLVGHLDVNRYKIHVGFYQANSYVDKCKDIGASIHLINRKPVVHGNILIRKFRNWYRLIYMHRQELSHIVERNNIELVILNNSVKSSNDIVNICNKKSIPIISYERGHLEYSVLDIRNTKDIVASIAVSKSIESNMKKQNYHAETHVIYDGLPIHDNEEYCVNVNDVRIKHEIGLPEDSIVVGIIGNIREWKGQEYFVKAFMLLGEKYKNLYGLVVGGHAAEDEEYLESIKNISRSSEVGLRLKYLGFRNDVPDLLKIFDVFIHASITPEPFGMVLLEAMFNKVPVIATNLGGPVEILVNGDCGILVPPRNEKAIVEGVEKYLDDPQFRSEMVNRAYKRVIDEFDLRKTVNLIDDLFQDVVSRAKT